MTVNGRRMAKTIGFMGIDPFRIGGAAGLAGIERLLDELVEELVA